MMDRINFTGAEGNRLAEVKLALIPYAHIPSEEEEGELKLHMLYAII